MNVRTRAKNVDENGVFCLVPEFPSWLVVLKSSKKCIFFNFVLTLAGDLQCVEEIHTYASKRSCYYVDKMYLYPNTHYESKQSQSNNKKV